LSPIPPVFIRHNVIVMESYVYNAVLWQFNNMNFLCILLIDELANRAHVFVTVGGH